MEIIYYMTFIFLTFDLGESYSKYGRTCKDIGCGSNEVCIMAQDPCSAYSGQDQCGMYPTCQKSSNSNSAPSCSGYICPPTKICRLDGDTPKCVDDDNAHTPDKPKSHQTLTSYNDNDSPSAPNPQPAYPVLPGQTTTRPAIRRPASNGNSGGYDGSSIGSGYPGQPRPGSYPGQGGGYPGQGSGYPGQGSGYPGQGSGYPGQGSGYPGQGSGFPGQGSGYPGQGGYQQGGYQQGGHQGGGYQPGGYQQGGYGGYQQPGYRQPSHGQASKPSSASNPIVDTITGTLKNLGLFCLLIRYLVSKVYGF